MKKNDKIAIVQKSAPELRKLLAETYQKHAEHRVKHANGTVKDSSLFKKLNYQISLITTLLSHQN